mmetsp:Transcript_105313/g.303851  ORF Transcript_105313/g.303851 Transcript_105313/m.303851 type:complete len:104 (+) Transcript_105313:2123-2434(+)
MLPREIHICPIIDQLLHELRFVKCLMDYFDQNTPLNLTPGLMNRGPGTEQLPHYLQLRQHHLVPLKEGINRTIQGDVTSILDTAGVKVALVSVSPQLCADIEQ